MTNRLPGMKEREIPTDRQDIYTFRPKSLEDLLDTLSPQEKIVLVHTYGLLDQTSKKQFEIAKIIERHRERVGAYKNKALRKLRHSLRRVYYAFLPDNLMQDVFGTTDIKEIINELSKDESFTGMKYEIIKEIKQMHNKYDRFADETSTYLRKLNDSYANFVNVLQGSKFTQHLNDINTMSMRLGSQCVNMQSTLQIAQKFLGTDIKLPHTQIQKFFDELSICMLNLNQLEDRFRESINYKELIFGKTEDR